MNIFYLEKDKFLKEMNLDELEKYSDGKVYKLREKYLEHLCGLYLVKTVARNIYEIENTEIGVMNSKPYFKNAELQFNISHSKNIVAAAFSNKNTGFDVEYMAERDYKKIAERISTESISKSLNREDFYKFWTTYEAEYKLGTKAVSRFTCEILKDYMYTVVSDCPMLSDFAVYKIWMPVQG